ncbi:Uncharacterised protein [Escherichia coli]|nr:hypothetical protein [Escherichia coli]STH42962.1 Uncharacterised protein [Escherichia coli]
MKQLFLLPVIQVLQKMDASYLSRQPYQTQCSSQQNRCLQYTGFLFSSLLVDVGKLATKILFLRQDVICMFLLICSGTDVISRRIYRRFSKGDFIVTATPTR